MNIVLAINAGSSSLKFQLIQMPDEVVSAKGLVERIGLKESVFQMEVDGKKEKTVGDIPNHAVAVKMLLDGLKSSGIITSLDEINAVGHRVVHGGEHFSDSVIITEEVIQRIEAVSELAPLHNPANLTGIHAFKEILPDVPMVAVFDTAFHQTMPKSSYLYSLPKNYYLDYGIRKYGFHGTSHKYVSQRAAVLMGVPLESLRIISCHIGNGASVTAIEGGKSIDTSMGFTPLAGVTMGTRSGDVDPALIPYIMDKTGKTADEVIHVLNEESGMLALSGFSSDLRDIEEQSATNERAELALNVFAERIHKYIGSYAAKMSGVDAIIFTAGVGENSIVVREKILTGLEFMGIYWDPKLNEGRSGKEQFINYPHSPVKVIIIPTDEEIMIARDTVRLTQIEKL